MEKIYVIGHKKPDTDAVCASVALSYLKNKMGLNAEPRVLSDINKETMFVLNKFKMKIPKYLNDVKQQINDVNYNKDFYTLDSKSIYKTYKQITKNDQTGIPVINFKKRFIGYASLKEIAKDLIINKTNYINTSSDNIASTLYASSFYNFKEFINGEITFKDIKEKSILITEEFIYDEKIELLILTNNKKLLKKEIDLINEKKYNVIITPYDIYKTSNLISLSNPISSIKIADDVITFTPSDYLTDFKEKSNKYKHTNYPIVNNKGICFGMMRLTDTSNVNKKNIILVDHNEINQSVDGINEANVLEIVDHHNIGNISTSAPINFRNMNVGSVNTVIYYMYKEQNIKIPKNIGALMLSGILSDTLLLKSPTTTLKDIEVANILSSHTNLNIEKYGLELLKSGVSIKGLTPLDIINKDFKTYTTGLNKIAVAQVFTTSFNEYKKDINKYVKELNNISKNHNYLVVTLFITDILTNDSYLLYNESSKKYLEEAYGKEDIKQGEIFKGYVSRKKQMVPNIMEVIEKV